MLAQEKYYNKLTIKKNKKTSDVRFSFCFFSSTKKKIYYRFVHLHFQFTKVRKRGKCEKIIK